MFSEPPTNDPTFYFFTRASRLRYISTDCRPTYHTTTLVSLLVNKLYNTVTTDTSEYLVLFAPTEVHNSNHHELLPGKRTTLIFVHNTLQQTWNRLPVQQTCARRDTRSERRFLDTFLLRYHCTR